jgi:SpoVK/Ycf46/Vps4 family AAA+-type ATPase
MPWIAEKFKIPFDYFNFNYLYLYPTLFCADESETRFESFTNYLKHGFSDCITAEELDLIERTQTAMAKRKYSILRAAQDIQAILNEAVIRRFRKGLDEFAEKLTEIGDHCLAGRVRLEIDLLKQIK